MFPKTESIYLMNKTFKQIIWLYNNYRSKLLRTTAVTISFNEQMKLIVH